MKKNIVFIIPMMLLTLVGCNSKPTADVIVYGNNIYTADTKNEFVEAFAVKDGKYLAVGSKESINAYKGKNTIVYDSKFVMPGATEAHGHFILSEAFKLGYFIKSTKENGDIITFEEICADLKDYRDAHPGLTGLYGYGWDLTKQGVPYKEMLDEIFPDIPVYLAEVSLHGGWCNSKCLKMVDAYDKDPGIANIDRDPDTGIAYGIIRDEACAYVRNKVFGPLLNDSLYQQAVKNAASRLNSLGYTAHYDMWSNFDGSSKMYESISAVDKANELTCLYGSAYCIEGFEKTEASKMIDEAVQLKQKYGSERYHPEYIKLFADGVIETFTGYVSKEYITKDFGYGSKLWEEDDMYPIIEEANRKGLLVHTHTMGDSAVSETIDGYIASENKNGYYRNSLGHVGLVKDSDWQRIKDHNIGVASGAVWACQTSQAEIDNFASGVIEEERTRALYPFEQYPQYGIKAALSTDAPCDGGAVLDVFGYLQVLVNGLDHNKPITPETIKRRNTFITVKEALEMFTINGAWMLNLENQRGSIEVGKYADFIIADKDPFTESKDNIYQIDVTNTFFEGNEVYKKTQQ